jgi:dihydroneopterin aldolase
MGIVALEGMKFFAYHGFYEEEQILGTDYILDVYVKTNFSKAAKSDELFIFENEEDEDEEDKIPTTVNYEIIYLLCKTAMAQKSKLLESIIERIADRIIEYYEETELVQGLYIRLRKMNPPLGGPVSNSCLITTRGEMDTPFLY